MNKLVALVANILTPIIQSNFCFQFVTVIIIIHYNNYLFGNAIAITHCWSLKLAIIINIIISVDPIIVVRWSYPNSSKFIGIETLKFAIRIMDMVNVKASQD